MKHAYGYLEGNPHFPMGGMAGGGVTYSYGSPTDPGVVAQWRFDEASGLDIVDEVAGLTLADMGTPTYGVAGTGGYSGMTGITLNGTDAYFRNAAAQASLNLGTNDAVFEWVQSFVDPGAGNTDLIFMSYASSVGWLCEITHTAIHTYYFRFRLYSGALDKDMDFAYSSSILGDGQFHKCRLLLDRSANAQMYMDGVQLGASVDISALAAVNYTAPNIYIGSYFGNELLAATLLEFRQTVGNCTNNSGGPGGG